MNSQISNQNTNFCLPDNIYQVESKEWRAGSKRQDLNAFGGLVVAGQEGVRVFEKEMKQIKNRKTVLEAPTNNIIRNSHLRDLARKPSLDEIEATMHGEVLRLF